MKFKIQWVIMVFALVTLCGCSVVPSKQNKTQAQKKPEKVNLAETAVFKNSETSVKTARLENDFIRIGSTYDDNGERVWLQENLDGTGRKQIEIGEDYYSVAWLTNDWLYYIGLSEKLHTESRRTTIGRIPFNSKAEPMFDVAGKEILIHCDYDVEEIMVTDDYLFYCEYDDFDTDSTYCYRYDFSTRENTGLYTLQDEWCGIAFDHTDLPSILGDDFFLIGTSGLYSVSLTSLEKEEFYHDDEMEDCCLMEVCDGVLYFVPGADKDAIYKYDGYQISSLLDEKEFQKAIKEMNLTDKNALDIKSSIRDMAIINDKFYAVVTISWISKEKVLEGPDKGKKDKNYHSRDVLLSGDMNDFSKWKLDDTLAGFMLDNFERDARILGEDAEGRTIFYKTDGKNTVDTLSEIDFIYHDQIGFHTILENDTLTYYLYDIKTGEIQQIDEDTYEIYDTID